VIPIEFSLDGISFKTYYTTHTSFDVSDIGNKRDLNLKMDRDENIINKIIDYVSNPTKINEKDLYIYCKSIRIGKLETDQNIFSIISHRLESSTSTKYLNGALKGMNVLWNGLESEATNRTTKTKSFSKSGDILSSLYSCDTLESELEDYDIDESALEDINPDLLIEHIRRGY